MKQNGIYSLMHVADDGKKPITISDDNIKYISEISFNEFQIHSDQVREYTKIIRLVDIVQLNISDFATTIDNYAKAHSISGEMNQKLMLHYITNISRLIINILNSFRSFEDHANIFISRNKNITPTDNTKWKTIKSKQYDTSRAYRIIYRLRNFCQHIGSPPLNIAFRKDFLKKTSSMTVELNRDSLLSEHKIWNDITKNDLLAQNAYFCILDLLIEWEKCFLEIAHELLSIANKYSLPHAKEIIEYRLRNRIHPGDGRMAIQYPVVASPEDNILRVKLLFLPEGTAHEVIADSEKTALRFPPIIGTLQ